MRREDFQVDRLPVDALVVTSNPCRFIFDLMLDLAKVSEFAPRNMMELGPLVLLCNACRCMRNMNFVAFGCVTLAGNVDKLQDQRPSGNYAATTRQKVPSDNVLEYRRFTRRLRTNDDL